VTALTHVAKFASERSDYITIDFSDIARIEPELLNAVKIRHQLDTLFYKGNCARKAELALKEAKFMNHILAGPHFACSCFILCCKYQQGKRTLDKQVLEYVSNSNDQLAVQPRMQLLCILAGQSDDLSDPAIRRFDHGQ
jgi:hypothetical protein